MADPLTHTGRFFAALYVVTLIAAVSIFFTVHWRYCAAFVFSVIILDIARSFRHRAQERAQAPQATDPNNPHH